MFQEDSSGAGGCVWEQTQNRRTLRRRRPLPQSRAAPLCAKQGSERALRTLWQKGRRTPWDRPCRSLRPPAGKGLSPPSPSPSPSSRSPAATTTCQPQPLSCPFPDQAWEVAPSVGWMQQVMPPLSSQTCRSFGALLTWLMCSCPANSHPQIIFAHDSVLSWQSFAGRASLCGFGELV